MGTPFLSEIRLLSFGFAPKGWALCNGQLLPINQNQALFSLLGTTYGGDGRVTFALPDLRSRVPIHEGAGHTLGQVGGEQAHTLTIAELPPHQHVAQRVDDVRRQPGPDRERPGADRRQPVLRAAVEPRARSRRGPWPTPAAARRTSTCSRS